MKATETHLNVKYWVGMDFAALAPESDIPVFALGGVAPEDLEQAQKHHAYGKSALVFVNLVQLIDQTCYNA